MKKKTHSFFFFSSREKRFDCGTSLSYSAYYNMKYILFVVNEPDTMWSAFFYLIFLNAYTSLVHSFALEMARDLFEEMRIQ